MNSDSVVYSVARAARVIFLFAFVLAAMQARGQNSDTAEMLGRVTDSTGAVIPSVIVKITNTSTGVGTQITTNKAGTFDDPLLAPGPYVVEFQANGFEKLVRTGIQLQLGQTARVDASLKIGSVSQTVTVGGNGPILDTSDSERSTNFNSTLVADLPTVGRDSTLLALLAPGTSTAQSELGGVDPGRRSVNGSRAFSISATVNGGSSVFPNSDNFLVLAPALGAVSQFNVIEDNFNAEYSTGTSVLNIVTKSGTNQFHGSLFEYIENNDLNAINYFAKNATPLHYNQPGGTIGGPILRNKLFFFFSYQTTLTPSTGVGFETVPTAAESAGNFDVSGIPVIKNPATGLPFNSNSIPTGDINSVAAKVLTYFPAPNEPGITNNYYYNTRTYEKIPVYDGRVDYTVAANNTLSFATHQYLRTITSSSAFPIPGSNCKYLEECTVAISDGRQYTLSDDWVLNSHKINEARFNLVRQFYSTVTKSVTNLPDSLGLTTLPQTYFPSFAASGAIPVTIGGGSASGGAQTTFSYGDDFTWTKGNHIFKFGGEYDTFNFNDLANLSSGSISFNGVFTGVGLADFLLGLPSSYSLDSQPTSFGARRRAFAAFAQDTYRMTSSLTVNYGLRYEGQGGFREVHNNLSNFDPTLINPVTNTPGAILFASSAHPYLQNNHFGLFAPRVGFAWSPVGSKWVVRGSYGLFFVPISAEENYNSSPPGYAILESLSNTNLSNPTPVFALPPGPPPYTVPTAADRTPSIQNGDSVTYYPPPAPYGYMQQWHFSVQRQISSSTLVEASYVGTKGTHLIFPRDLNQVPQSAFGPGNLQTARPFPQFLTITSINSDGYSNYNALQLQLNRRLSRGLTFLSNYTWSRSLDDCSLDFTTGNGCPFQNAYRPQTMYAPSQFDETHRVVISSAYDIPVGLGRQYMNRSGIANVVLGGWTAAESFYANTGFPITVDADIPTPALSGSLFANVKGDPNVSNPTIAKWFNTSAFSNPAPYTFGNSSRDMIRGPGYWDVDAALSKFIPLPIGTKDRYQLGVRADAFNVLNHPTFGQPNSTVGSTATGTITSTAATARELQVGLVLKF